MLYEMIFSYLAIGAAWMLIEIWAGAGLYLGRACAKEAATLPSSLVPLAAALVAVIVVFFLALTLAFWPYFVWDDWRRGNLLKPGRWGDDKE
ncbi:hypothetical protein sortkaff_5 [Escherichia phage sortkaff]|uniref:Uncharacterized protein n=1 Tax=Escherichia phage sortkaff TaxID=2696445 RepID=A0A6C0R130_9CAUD|nr:hypothetical protein sortkaff_5 [Escherichia phage sortkaff]